MYAKKLIRSSLKENVDKNRVPIFEYIPKTTEAALQSPRISFPEESDTEIVFSNKMLTYSKSSGPEREKRNKEGETK